jgi:amino acid permease
MDKQSKSGNSEKKKYPWTAKRIAAWVCIIALVAMYVVTLAAAIMSKPGADTLFKSSLALTIFLPIVCWVFIWLYGFFTDKKTIASLNILNSNPEARKKMEDEIKDSENKTIKNKTSENKEQKS